MAKMGEGDKRWLVEDLKDGTNVNGWHWAEKDVLVWARQRLTELLGNVTLTKEAGFLLQTTSVSTVTGEAFVNNRKRKLIPSYEIALQGSWKGHGNSGETCEGTFSMPYIADENADEDPELKVSTATEGPLQQRAKQVFMAHKEALLAPVRVFVREIQSGGPVSKVSGEGGEAAETPQPAKSTFVKASDQKSKDAAARSAPGSKRSLKMTERFYARRQDLWDCFTDTQRLQAFTRGPAVAEPRVGGRFEIFGGAVEGTFTAMDAPKTLTLDWRFKNWPDDVVSKVVIKLEEPEQGNCILQLSHTGIPEEDRFGNADTFSTTRQGWQQRIFHSIRAVFGYGL